ncbi:unnamed protein product [Pedinophyceae sp. YPF-701]|nr:unnamed protein product [Pedinophyceae sp. YPF-701]
MDGISADQLAEFAQTFSMFDPNDRGYFVRADVQRVLAQVTSKELSVAELEDIMSEYDVEGDGEITFDMFLTVQVRKMKDSDFEEPARQLFKLLGKGKDDGLRPKELARLLEKVGENPEASQVEELVQMVDEDGKGLVELDELKRLLAGSDELYRKLNDG